MHTALLESPPTTRPAARRTNAYDEVAYPGFAYPQTHPGRLAAVARLFGLEAGDVARCRVLELGCGDGGNLIPMAYGLPASEFVGIDLAARPIAAAQAAAAAVGVRNATFRELDLTRLPDELGEFDYIIAHGVYSWVPVEVRDALLAACARHLAANGIAFVSYNTFPGGHVRRMVREMLLYHVHRAPDSRTRIGQSLAFLKFLAESATADDEYCALLKGEFARARRYDPGYLFHDDLAAVNEPVYFHEFAEQAARHRLQFLAEADYFSMDLRQFPAATREALAPLADNVLAREQYLDFLRCRRFRQTLLCREGIALERPASPAHTERLLFASLAQPVSAAPDLAEGRDEEFTGARGSSMRTPSALGKAVMLALADAWPGRLAFDELRARALARLGASGRDPDPAPLASFLLEACGLGVIEAHTHCPAFVATPGERPRASAIARRQAEAGRIVANLLHATVRVEDEAARALICALDGSRARAGLVAELARSDPATTEEVIEQNLRVLARLGLIEA